MSVPAPKPIAERILAVLFVAGMAYFAGTNGATLRDAVRTVRAAGHPSFRAAIAAFEKTYSDKFVQKAEFLDLNARLHLALGQKFMNNVLKDEAGSLHFIRTAMPPRGKFVADAQSLNTIYRRARERNLPFLYVQRPYKVIRDETVLPPGWTDSTNDRYDLRLDVIRELGIPALDLRDALRGRLEFYKTDHHWSVRSAFLASKSIVDELNSRYGLGLDPDGALTDLDRYESLRYPISFLGSQGVRVGPRFAGKDDFEMLVPRFETDLHYRHFTAHKPDRETRGAFPEVFVNFNLLENPVYLNKYNACLKGGYVENVVENLRADNELKVLFIADSFSRPLVQYLSLCFREFRQIDPQTGRYTDSYLAYLDDYRPDVVLVMFDGPIPL